MVLVQSVSVFGIERFGSILSSESWFRAAGCLSATGGSQLGSKLSVAAELMVGSSLSTYGSLVANDLFSARSSVRLQGPGMLISGNVENGSTLMVMKFEADTRT